MKCARYLQFDDTQSSSDSSASDSALTSPSPRPRGRLSDNAHPAPLITPTNGETSNKKRHRSLDRPSMARSSRHTKRSRKSSLSRSRSGGPPSSTRRRQDQKDDILPADEPLAALQYTTSDYGILGAWIMKDKPPSDKPVNIAISLSKLAESAVSAIFSLNIQLLIFMHSSGWTSPACLVVDGALLC